LRILYAKLTATRRISNLSA